MRLEGGVCLARQSPNSPHAKAAKAPRRASSRREADQQDAPAVTLNRGMLLHPPRTLQRAAQRWWWLCAGAGTTTDTMRRAPAAVVGGGVLLVTFRYSASRLFLRTARATDQADRPTRCGSEACHCCERRTILDPPTSLRRVRERCAQQRTETSAVDLETDQPGADARTTRSSPMDTLRSDWPSRNPRADSKGGS